jgi:molybdopterin-containing oxidoreductase family membrane subunit
MVLTLAIPIRAIYGLEDFITSRHLQNMAKVMLVTGLVVAYGYLTELFVMWYSADEFEMFTALNRMTGPYAVAYWSLIFCNVVVLQTLWFRRVRTSVAGLFAVAVVVNIGMWLERFVIVVSSESETFLPATWGTQTLTWLDYGLLFGSLGTFFALIFLFVRILPAISIFEVEELAHEEGKA